MGFENQTFHMVVESIVLIIIPYLFWLAFKQKILLRKIFLLIIGFGNLIIDVFALISWFLKPFF